MPTFAYSGRRQGQAVRGRLEAVSADAAAGSLLGSGVTPIEIHEARADVDVVEWLSDHLGRRPVGAEELLLFTRQMHAVVRSGIPLLRGLGGVLESTRHPGLTAAIEDVMERISAGQGLADSLQRHPDVFSPLFVSLVNMGENTGQLEAAFAQLTTYIERDRDTRKQIKSATRYPTFIGIAVVAAMVVLNLFALPAFAKVYASFDAKLPLPTRILMGISRFSVQWWPLLLGVTVVASVGVRYYLRTPAGRLRWDRTKLRLPIVGSIIQRATLARFSRAFSLSLRSGIPMLEALSIAARVVDNDWVAERLLAMRAQLERGETLTRTAASSELFTPLVLRMMAVGEETGSLDDLLEEASAFYEREVDYDIKRIGDSIEPLLLVVAGGVVLVLALGIYLPMWDLARAVHAGG